jgi:hypothetical protein
MVLASAERRQAKRANGGYAGGNVRLGFHVVTDTRFLGPLPSRMIEPRRRSQSENRAITHARGSVWLMGRGQRDNHQSSGARDPAEVDDERLFRVALERLNATPAATPHEQRAREVVSRVTTLSEEERDELLAAARVQRSYDGDGLLALAALRRAQQAAAEAGQATVLHTLTFACWHGARARIRDEPEKVADELGVLAARAATASLTADLLTPSDLELLVAPWRAVFGGFV